jgi:hydrogenase maturation factor
MPRDDLAGSCLDRHCITCGDLGVAMRVVAIDEARGLALCEEQAGTRSTVEIGLVDAALGDSLHVHAGTAIARLEEAA